MNNSPAHQDLREALGGCEGVQLALLFGSRARGQHRPDADFDIGVEVEIGEAPLDPAALSSHLSVVVGSEVDIVDLRQLSYPLLKAILRDGIVLYESKRGVAGAWRAQALSRLDWDRPWFERMRSAFLDRLADERG